MRHQRQQIKVTDGHTLEKYDFAPVTLAYIFTLSHKCFLMPLQHTAFENILTKGEIAQNKQFFHCHNVVNLFQYLYFHLQSFLPPYFLNFLQQICCMWERGKVLIYGGIAYNM